MRHEDGRGQVVEGFQDLIAWQKAREFTRSIYQATTRGALARDHGLSGQMQRAGVSIMSDIAEGYERDSRAEFHRFLAISKASCAETRSLLYVALDAGYIDQQSFDGLMSRAREVSRVVGGLRAAVGRQLAETSPPRKTR